ncbi:hypothetical protein BOTBODRAFT_511908 [Botryobasidium botryosum FD-172 SS1]|uniref:Uncharacterized protein n=1 Tax=Botryobasidium botryosum (strain FD-172 SS1) TaxID=930990 RepID=A0A067MUR6_BOTB1|nr:hypothetical protein BOTBODRAFT_511908 [Botryobasidium botryosum FD-172 SS1]
MADAQATSSDVPESQSLPESQPDSLIAPNKPKKAKSSETSIASLKGNKIAFRQKAVDWRNGLITMKALVAFNEYLDTLSTPLETIPDAHLPLIGKLVQESDKTLPNLVKHLKKTLLRSGDMGEGDDSSDSQDKLPPVALEIAIRAVADRVNYGIDDAPAALCVWRWEVKDLEALPHESTASMKKMEERRAERVQAKANITTIFGALGPAEKENLLGKKGPPQKKDQVDDTNAPPTEPSKETNGVSTEKKSAKAKEQATKPKAEPSEKEKEKLKKRAIKAEKEKKENEDMQKSAAKLASFFSKTPATKPKPAPKASSSKSDFQRTFYPFVVKKDTKLAPVNRFQLEKQRRKNDVVDVDGNEVIVIDADDDDKMDVDEVEEASGEPVEDRSSVLGKSSKDILAEFISTVPPSRRVRPSLYESSSQFPGGKLKSTSCYTVRALMAKLTEAGVNDDLKTVQRITDLLNDRKKVPVKLLQFCESRRPAYYGTWTKSSTLVGPRTPFARDLVTFDYSYNSDDDWEDEETGDAEEVMSANEESEDDVSEEESEFDWIVGDDEILDESNEGDPLLRRSRSPALPIPASRTKKRKGEDAAEASRKRRMLTGPLVPFCKGPCVETVIGQCDYEPFESYRIQLLNDSPFPLDPFTFVSAPVTTAMLASQTAASSSSLAAVVPPTADGVSFAVPQLPSHLASQPPSSPMPASATQTPTATKRPPAKFTLSDQRLLDFLRAIEGSTKTKPGLRDELFELFSVDGLRKGAIEAKVAEVAIKEKKVWKVKDEFWHLVGAARP